jgi:hypothetical protein
VGASRDHLAFLCVCGRVQETAIISEIAEGATMRVLLVIMMSALLGGSAAAQERAYACVSDAATGFTSLDKKPYEPIKFVPLQLTITMMFDGKIARIKKPTSDEEEIYTCSVPWPHVQPRLFDCVERFYHLAFDEARLRFSYAQIYGHVGESDDPMALAYGSCQKR